MKSAIMDAAKAELRTKELQVNFVRNLGRLTQRWKEDNSMTFSMFVNQVADLAVWTSSEYLKAYKLKQGLPEKTWTPKEPEDL